MARGIITNYHYDTDIWYTTKVDDEVIVFKDKNLERREIEDWVISANTTNLLISVIRTERYPNTEEIAYESDIISILANSDWRDGGITKIHGIKVHGLAGQKIKWIGNYN